jgi:Sulfotransferase domain
VAREPLFHDVPGRPGHPRYDVDLVSPEVPSGAAWLANCLLELGISVWKPWGSDDSTQWETLDGLRCRYVGGDNGWSRVLPALRHGRVFRFRPSPCVRAHHTWPDVYPSTTRRILFVRDPRDALYSSWHRKQRSGAIAATVDFVDFCGSPFFHFPISWQDHLLLFLRVAWLAAERDGARVVRFEDYRRDPSGTLEGVLGHLQVDVQPPALRAAVEASSIDRVKAEDRRLASLGIVDSTLVRGGAPGEHRLHFDERARRRVGDRFADVCARFGYEHVPTSPPSRDRPAAGTLAAIIAALRTSGVPVEESGWLSTALGESLQGIRLLPTSAT